MEIKQKEPCYARKYIFNSSNKKRKMLCIATNGSRINHGKCKFSYISPPLHDCHEFQILRLN